MILYAGSFTEMIDDTLGGHGDGIYCLDFDPSNGLLRQRHQATAVNPTYLSIPSAQRLYTHTELLASKSPRIQAYRINPQDFSLELINERPVPGGCPCHIQYFKPNDCMLLSCYETGNVFVYPLGAQGQLLPLAGTIQHEGRSVNELRQEKAHAHAAIADAVEHILVPDLGMDKIVAYQLVQQNDDFRPVMIQQLTQPPGSGPRHIGIHFETNRIFLMSELTAAVSAMRYRNRHIEVICTSPTLPKEFTGVPSGAAIRVSANGKFIYTSERISGCVTVLRFDPDSETLEIVDRQSTLGKTPRDVHLDPSGRWLLAANQDSDSIAVFGIDEITGNIKAVHLAEGIKSPACLEWLPRE